MREKKEVAEEEHEVIRNVTDENISGWIRTGEDVMLS